MNRKFTLATILVVTALTLSAQEAETASHLTVAPGLGLKFDTRDASTPSQLGIMDFSFESKTFSLAAQLLGSNDGKYSPLKSNQQGGTFFDYYAFLKAGGLEWRPSDELSFRAGRLEHRDVLDNPYSLFVSSTAPAANILQIRYENDYFFYESRWVELNKDSGMFTTAYPETATFYDYPDNADDSYSHTGPFPDRGSNIKTYGFKLGDMVFGFQDAAVYVDRSFDLEYLLSPLPQYFTQYVKGTAGRPWATGNNENDMIGAFWAWKRDDGLSFDAQFLMDDFNLYFLGIGKWNPGKGAWAMRAKLDTDIGTFAFSHAAALKYTFEPTRDELSECYSYTYYPDTRFSIDDPSDRSIGMEDLMIGYKHGENNIAFRLDYEGTWYGFDLSSYGEFVLSGSKSPTNAWHDAFWHDYRGSRILDEDVLEKLVLLNIAASRRFGDFTVSATLLAGCAFNALELTAPDTSDLSTKTKYDVKRTINSGSWIWKPGDKNEPIFGAGIFVRWDIPITPFLKDINRK
jgi:hypothetical protein